MRKIVVSNICSLDGYYEGKNRSLDALFDYFHEDYYGDQTLDHYNADLLRASDTLIQAGRDSFLGNKGYWTGIPHDPNATPIRRELADLFKSISKIVVSDHLNSAEVAPWDNTRIVKLADSHMEIAALKRAARPGYPDPDEPFTLE